MYVEFMKEIRRAEVDAKIRKIAIIEKACVDDPKIALEILSRKYPKEWGRKQLIGIEATVHGSGVDVSEVISKIREELGAGKG